MRISNLHPCLLIGIVILICYVLCSFIFICVVASSWSGASATSPCDVSANCSDNCFKTTASSLSVLMNCSGDGFKTVAYPLADGHVAYLKYKLFDQGRDLFSFADAKRKCEQLDAELWQVSSGEEWDQMYSVMKRTDPDKLDMWLDASVAERCVSGSASVCRRNEAEAGRGLEVAWSGVNGTYSRLIGGSDGDCVHVSEDAGLETPFWKSARCNTETYHAACVKRHCRVP